LPTRRGSGTVSPGLGSQFGASGCGCANLTSSIQRTFWPSSSFLSFLLPSVALCYSLLGGSGDGARETAMLSLWTSIPMNRTGPCATAGTDPRMVAAGAVAAVGASRRAGEHLG